MLSRKWLLCWERLLLIDNNGGSDVRNHDGGLEIHIDNGHGVFHVHDRILDDDVCALNNIFLVDDNGVGYNYKPVHGDARYNHGDDDLYSRWDNLNQY
ncbi:MULTISPECIES: hypothetical protein [Methylophaga]|uniref:Uncharacterized protein n=1 Tax=Methylophaga muralis TaxID=291169 RepID=A0A1E3GVZ1_9GAMM|nr:MULTISPECIES: hypothetical protein [Methylophaga]ODN68232.1 hypothetical protein A9E74_00204 [Methylophaga muralis]THK41655.1 hypothetical protein E8Q33_07195 [Methylophaga sp. SB9B]